VRKGKKEEEKSQEEERKDAQQPIDSYSHHVILLGQISFLVAISLSQTLPYLFDLEAHDPGCRLPLLTRAA
jgi:hypothetical protein